VSEGVLRATLVPERAVSPFFFDVNSTQCWCGRNERKTVFLAGVFAMRAVRWQGLQDGILNARTAATALFLKVAP